MSELKEVITSYNNLSFCDRIVFYTTISNDITITDDVQSFLIDTRFEGDCSCIYCEGTHVVKNGKRKDGVQRFLCRDCRKSFIASSDSITSRTRKSVSVWTTYLRCMLDQKTLKQSSEECNISMATAFTWRHKILDTLSELTEKAYLTGVVEADETFFNVSFKGNHKRSHSFIMPREAHKRGNDVHTKGLSSEKVCVPCAMNAYHCRLKHFVRRFHGVSTKHLGNYIVWNNLLSGNRRNSEAFFGQLWGQLLCARITRYGKDISRRPSLPATA